MNMKKRILIIRSQDILTDSRIQRYEKWFQKQHIPYKILGWNREEKTIKRENTHYCPLRAGYNLGVEGIKYRIKWNIYVLKYLLSNCKQYDIIHACDFDTIFPALLMKMIGKKVIFDIFDWSSDELKTGKRAIDFTINKLERLATKLSDLTIICEEERLRQMKIIPKQYMVIPNIPFLDTSQLQDEYLLADTDLKLGYIGGFYPHRGLEELIEVVVKLPHIHLTVGGFGEKEIEEKIRKASEEYSHIHYIGKVEYSEALRVMSQCHVLYGMYYKTNPNHLYAAPNKFYESIFLRKPLITTLGTLVGEKVTTHHTGYAIEEGVQPLYELLMSLTKEQLEDKKIDLNRSYKRYKNFWQTQMYQYETLLQLNN